MDLKTFIKKYTGQKVDYDKKFGPQCFTKDHCVLMADWTYKPIQDVKVGDKVIGFDNEVNTVTKLFKREAQVVHINTELGDFFVTGGHPFYFADGTFSPATELCNKLPALFDKENYARSGLTDEELLFLGFWLGDGNIATHCDNRADEIRITYGAKNRDFVLSLGLTGNERKHHECANAYASGLLKRGHEKLAQVIYSCAGEYKKLPLIFSNREYELIIRGLIHADGTPHHNSYVITNTSFPLLYSVQAMCIKLGYCTKSVRLSRRKSEYIRIKGKLVKSVKPLYRLTLSKQSKRPEHRYAKILEVKKDTVYNLETDGTHTYICNNYKVHNCVDLFRQYCADVLNVGHTGAVEGAKDLYLKYDELPKEKEVFARIEKKRISRYMPGTVVVFGATPANRFGHVAIVVDEFEGELIVFEQDGFRQDGAKLVIRDTKNVLGVLVAYDFR